MASSSPNAGPFTQQQLRQALLPHRIVDSSDNPRLQDRSNPLAQVQRMFTKAYQELQALDHSVNEPLLPAQRPSDYSQTTSSSAPLGSTNSSGTESAPAVGSERHAIPVEQAPATETLDHSNPHSDNAPGQSCRPPLVHSIPQLRDAEPFMACFRCGRRFNLFRRKHHCRNCGNVLCADCTHNEWVIPKFAYYEPVRVCDLCDRLLEISTMDKEQLQVLSIRALRSYIDAYRLPCTGMLEKSDLVSLIFDSQPLPDVHERAFRNGLPTPSPRPTEATDADNSWLPRHTVFPGVMDIEELMEQLYGLEAEPLPRQSPFVRRTRPSSSSSSHRPRSQARPSAPAGYNTTPHPTSSSHHMPSNTTPTTQTSSPPTVAAPSLATIIANKIDIATLSIATLKAILAEHCVDYSQVIEKSELMSLVNQLLVNTRAELAQYTQNTDDTDNQCKICYDHPINSLILECGHLVTCLDCAKRLQTTTNECPICRQRITRVVHVFKT
ncbi:hypothetical protein IWQ62_001091 [Dispira parvispora]|uniref:FYVE-type domain-containing protein n=1 Tax=Dispira parvispora TaxID=1520584 RepID=A0A9W8AWX8_9FUNG|nr:hypothetical protein IWQ62_001091 [Dispira parvispora]